VHHIRSTPHHPMTLGKIERLRQPLKEEFLARARFETFEEARERIGYWASTTTMLADLSACVAESPSACEWHHYRIPSVLWLEAWASAGSGIDGQEREAWPSRRGRPSRSMALSHLRADA
jgi:hypothetical protein